MPPALPALMVALALAADPRSQLETVQARKAAEEAAARALAEREGSLLGALDAVERGLVEADGSARTAEERRASAAGRLARARAAEDRAESRHRALEAELGPRLRARAREGRGAEVRLLLAASSFAELATRARLWRRLTAHDLGLLASAREAVAALAAARVQAEREGAEVEARAREAREGRALAAARRDEQRALLASIRGARSLHEQAAEEAARQEGQLADFVASLPVAHGGPLHTGFSLLRGKLPSPVAGVVTSGFGRVIDPRFGTVTVQKGVDIRAPAGAEVRAVAPGRVAHAGWFKGYGNLVIVDHGDGYHTLVAHLRSMSTAMGEEVEAGSALGTVGDTGPLGNPSVYFEIRDRGRPVDPAGWLSRP